MSTDEPGIVQKINFESGQTVKAGDLLYRIDPSDFQAALDLASAQVERDEASLDYLRSNDVERYRALIARLGLRR